MWTVHLIWIRNLFSQVEPRSELRINILQLLVIPHQKGTYIYYKGRTIKKTIGWGGVGDVQQILMQGNI